MTSRHRRPVPARIVAVTVGLADLLAAYLVATTPRADAAEAVLSRNTPVAVSSTENAGTPAVAAVDGNIGTRWSSAFTATAWIQVDLGAPATLSRVAVTWENAYAKAFTIQLSADGAAYTQAYQTSSGTGGQQRIPVTGTAGY